jgi:4-hydroxy-tetrahydrodipicolinate synthase
MKTREDHIHSIIYNFVVFYANHNIGPPDDSLTLPFISAGARGVISVASNIIPEVISKLVIGALQNDWESAQELHHQYYPVFGGLLKLDTNPGHIKTALALAGLIENEFRLPLVPLSPSKLDELHAILKNAGIAIASDA